MKIDIIAGARPNFIKIAPIIHEINNIQSLHGISYRLIHTGQHYDDNMSHTFFSQLGIPEPHYNLEAGGGTQAELTGAIMLGYENILLSAKSDICIVVGDVTSSMACAITAQKMGIKVAHVEAGIRSGDWTMPEEINRIIIDSISNFFFTTTESASYTLLNSGVDKRNIFFVGNIMIDTLLQNRHRFFSPKIWDDVQLRDKEYILLTMHRPSNVDEKSKFENLIKEIIENAKGLPIIFPVHPRARKTLSIILNKDKTDVFKSLYLIDPLSYLEFNYLVERAKVVITDSGGITEETTVLGVPCITLRDNTERPETVVIGTNELIGTNPKAIKPVLTKLFEKKWKEGKIPRYWDGKTASRILTHLIELNV